jgi:putative transposase
LPRRASRRRADQLRERFPKISTLIDDAESDVLAHVGFSQGAPAAESRDRPARTAKRRDQARHRRRVIFHKEAAIVHLVGAFLLEQNDEWQLQRRYLQLEGLQALGHTQPARIPAVIS